VVGWGFELDAAREGKSRLPGPWVRVLHKSEEKIGFALGSFSCFFGSEEARARRVLVERSDLWARASAPETQGPALVPSEVPHAFFGR
jgi:hypothetical protein